MKCHQCSRPAFFRQGPNGDIPLCLSCSSKLQDILNAQFIQNAAMMNQALDDMDMVVGINSGGPRLPVGQLARAMQKAPTYTNIRVSNSQVGVLNTGEIARIDAAITLTKDSDVEAIGGQLQLLTQAIVNASDIDAAIKTDLIDLLQSLSEQIIGKRKPSVIRSLLGSIEERAKGFNSIATAASTLAKAVYSLFS